MEYVAGGSVGQLVKKMPEALSDEVARKYVAQVVDGLRYLHRRGVLHRDIKGDNLLISNTGEVKIADFGSAKLLQGAASVYASPSIASPRRSGGLPSGRRGSIPVGASGDDAWYQQQFGSFEVPTFSHQGSSADMRESSSGNKEQPTATQLQECHTIVGTPLWMAPEVINPEGPLATLGPKAAPKADVWSLGITVAEIIGRGEAPWPSFSSLFAAMLYIGQDKHAPTIPSHATELCADFIRRCCTVDPRQRPSARQLMQHPWIADACRAVTKRRLSNGGGHSSDLEAGEDNAMLDRLASMKVRSAAEDLELQLQHAVVGN